jgi:hypothetical protein
MLDRVSKRSHSAGKWYCGGSEPASDREDAANWNGGMKISGGVRWGLKMGPVRQMLWPVLRKPMTGAQERGV